MGNYADKRLYAFPEVRAEKQEISESTLPNYFKPIKLFCEENDIVLNWKKVSRRIPRGRGHADDRIPTVDEIKRLLEYPDRRVKIAILAMLSSGCRVGSFDYLNWGHIEPIEKSKVLVAAKIRIYSGTSDKYFSFISPETFNAIQSDIEFRKASGEKITKDSPLLRDLFPPEKGAEGEPRQSR